MVEAVLSVCIPRGVVSVAVLAVLVCMVLYVWYLCGFKLVCIMMI